ncbi:RTA1 like domain containing protein [Rhypophila sp. PSN 637]
MEGLHQLAATATTQLLATRSEDEDAPPTWCVSAVPGPNGNVPVSACNAYYNYDPQFAPSLAVAIIFGIITVIHIVEAFLYKKKYSWVIIMGSLWETIAFAIHCLGTKDQQVAAYSVAWTLLFLLAPLWINAYAYMTFARMVQYWHPEQKVFLKAKTIGMWFVLADIVSFIIQAAGGVMASPGNDPEYIKRGLDIYTGGTALQQFFIFIFIGLMIVFQRRVSQVGNVGYTYANETGGVPKKSYRPLLFALYGTLLFITIRIMFRIVEFAKGFGPENPIPFNEVYIYALDVLPMMVALLILAVFHPGRFLIGPDSEFPKISRKEKKAIKMMRREEKRNAKRGIVDSEASSTRY